MPPGQHGINEDNSNSKRLIRKATKLQQRHLLQLLAPFLVNVEAKKSTSPLPPSASSSSVGDEGGMGQNGGKKVAEAPAGDGGQPAGAADEQIRLCTKDSEPLLLDCQWGTRLNQDDTDWVFQLFRHNMRQLYLKSNWGYDECMKLQELQATTARFLILRDMHQRPIAYSHFRFVDDDGRPVLYCYEIQVEMDYQQKGAGTLLVRMMERLGKGTQMESMMSTVFAFNSASLAFFHKLGFRSDRTCLFGKDCGENCQGRDFVILNKRIDGKEDEEVDGEEDEEGKSRVKEEEEEENDGKQQNNREATSEECAKRKENENKMAIENGNVKEQQRHKEGAMRKGKKGGRRNGGRV